jgi:hypothetical protein
MKKLPNGHVDITSKWRRELGWTAGRLWHYLGKYGEVPIETLLNDYKKIVTPELVELLGPELDKTWGVGMALGWLMCEDKVIVYGDIDTHEWISACLTPAEQEIYQKAHYKE